MFNVKAVRPPSKVNISLVSEEKDLLKLVCLVSHNGKCFITQSVRPCNGANLSCAKFKEEYGKGVREAFAGSVASALGKHI